MRFCSGLVTLITLTIAGCSSSSQSIQGPTGTRCEVAAALSQPSFSPAGGTGTLTVSTQRDCPWDISADAGWVTVDRAHGQGEAAIPYRVTANATPAPRRATVVVDAAHLEVAQEGAPCRFAVDPTQDEVGPTGGSVVVRVSALNGCAWSARGQDGWIRVVPASGNGQGTVTLVVSANAGAARQSTATIAGQPVRVTQSAALPSPAPPAPPLPAPSPSPAPPPSPVPPETTVRLSGRVASLGGSCPDITFTVDGHSVDADGVTQYRRGNCRHVTNGAGVEIRGRRQVSGRVRAEAVVIVDRNGNGNDRDDDDD